MQKQQTAIVLGVPFLAIASVVLFGNPLFEGNDDTGLAMIGAGFGLAVEPEPHLIFSHYGYGLLIGAVSRLAGPNAHGWISLAALALSIGLVLRALSQAEREASALAGAALLIAAAIFSRALLELQFTITAALLFGSAIGCWLIVLGKGARSPGLSAIIYGALVLSFLMRPSAAALGCVVIGPMLLWLAWRGPVDSRRPTRQLLIGIAAIALMAYLTDKAAYAFSADWRDAVEYNQLRSLFNDYFRIPWIPGAPEYAQVGWSANDHAMFMHWYSFHRIFDLASIKFLAQTLLLQTPALTFSGVGNWLAAPWHSPILLALVVIQLALCALLPRQRLLVLLVLIGTFAALAIAGLSGRPPVFRVLFSAIGVALLCTLPLLQTAQTGLRLFQKIGFGALAALGLYAGSITIEAHQKQVAEAAAYRATLAGAAPYFSGLVISWASGVAWEWLVTPTKVHAPIAGLTVPSIGVFNRTPVTQATLRRLGIADFGSTLCTRPDVRLIADPEYIELLGIFCEEHYHIRPTYNLVFDNTRTQIFVSGQPGRKE
jgi:hypothetical protein